MKIIKWIGNLLLAEALSNFKALFLLDESVALRTETINIKRNLSEGSSTVSHVSRADDVNEVGLYANKLNSQAKPFAEKDANVERPSKFFITFLFLSRAKHFRFEAKINFHQKIFFAQENSKNLL